MPKYSEEFKQLLPTIAQIVSYIETNLGGTVFPSDEKDRKAVNFRWKKMKPNTTEVLRYNYVVPYLELESAIEAMIIAKSIVEKFEKGIEDA